MIEPDEVFRRHTARGTSYEVWRWTCPVCKQKKSDLYIDGQWCHGDGQVFNMCNGETWEGCFPCAIERERSKQQ